MVNAESKGHKKREAKLPHFCLSAVWTGFEPATPCVTGMYSNQLNYQTFSTAVSSGTLK